jgi:16S rRNA (uracil1498-N3)-methyltransferase
VTDPVFLADELGDPAVGDRVRLDGAEGRHAVRVRRARLGEWLVIADGRGSGVRGAVVDLESAALTVEVAEVLNAPIRAVHWVAAQALAKGDRDQAAIEMLTEVGVDEVIPWQAPRSVSRWSADRIERGVGRWSATVREAAKQSRRLRVPQVSHPLDTRGLAERISTADLALVLHEDAAEPIADVVVPTAGEVALVVGPEGGIGPDELAVLVAAGGRPISLGATVLRTSTAGVAALAALTMRPAAVAGTSGGR